MSEVQEGFDRTKRELLSAGRNLWLAGLGAVAEAGEEGRGLFDRLVERGRPLDARQRQAIGKTIETLGALAAAEQEGSKMFSRLVDRGREVESRGKVDVQETVDRAKAKAGDTWDDLAGKWGDKVDEKLTATLHRLGVPTREEIRALTL